MHDIIVYALRFLFFFSSVCSTTFLPMRALLHKMATFKLEAFHIKVYKMKSGFLWGKKKHPPPPKLLVVLWCVLIAFFYKPFFAPRRLQAVFLSGKIQNRPTTRLIWFSHICCFISLAQIRRSGASVRLSIGRRQVSHQPPPTISYPPHWNRPQMEMV